MTRWQAAGAAVVIARSWVMVGFAKANLIGDLTMTDEMMPLRSLIKKAADTRLLREMIGFATERLPRPGMGSSHAGARAGPASYTTQRGTTLRAASR